MTLETGLIYGLLLLVAGSVGLVAFAITLKKREKPHRHDGTYPTRA